jgi:hypothetical protein
MVGSIIFSPDNDTSYCDSPCDGKLIERADKSMICSVCARVYESNTTGVLQHHYGLQPLVNPYATDDGQPLVSMTQYANTHKKKKGITDFEDDYLCAKKSGFSITESYEYLPEDER